MQIRFGDSLIDTERRQVFRGDREILLAPKAFELLRMLIEARPKAIAKEKLQRQLWPNTFVVAANLPNLISEIRAALGDSAQQSRILRTVHRFGYAFAAEAETVRAGTETPAAGQSRCWLQWDTVQLSLSEGENIIGRGADVEVRIQASGVSRRHARLTVDGGHCAIEDLQSKNGTLVGGDRINSRRVLRSGDDIQFGVARATLHVGPPGASTTTISRRRLR
jgi:DNA-binding winged helix-turn-helix (wHTH) protein